MKTSYHTEKGISSAQVIRDDEKLALLSLSIQVPDAHLFTEAEWRAYGLLLTSGTKSLSRTEFLDALSMNGADLDMSRDGSWVHMKLVMLEHNIQKVMPLIEDMLLHPAFSAKELTRVRTFQTNVLTLAKENARLCAERNFYTTLTPKDDILHFAPIDTVIEHTREVAAKRVKKLHSTILNAHWYITVAGSTKGTQTVFRGIAKIKKQCALTDPLSTQITRIPTPKRTLAALHMPGKQNIEFSIGNAVPRTWNDPEYPALVLGMGVLALQGGFAGRLMSIVREAEGLTYGIYGVIERVTPIAHGFWRITTFFAPKHAAQGLRSTFREIDLICTEGITKDELGRFTDILKTRRELKNDSLLRKAGEVHSRLCAHIDETQYEQFINALELLTTERVNAALKAHIQKDACVISAAGPIQKVRSEIDAVLKEQPSV